MRGIGGRPSLTADRELPIPATADLVAREYAGSAAADQSLPVLDIASAVADAAKLVAVRAVNVVELADADKEVSRPPPTSASAGGEVDPRMHSAHRELLAGRDLTANWRPLVKAKGPRCESGRPQTLGLRKMDDVMQAVAVV